MDTSNPVLPSDRRTIKEMREIQRRRRRQDLAYLQDVVQTSTRLLLPVQSDLLPGTEVREEVARFIKAIPQVSTLKEEEIPSVLVPQPHPMPVCGITRDDGTPLHPAGINNNKGHVSVRRAMGGQPGPPLGLGNIVEVFGADVNSVKHVYTGGTWRGFVKRIGKQMGRKTVSVRAMFRKELGYKPSTKKLFEILDDLFPRGESGWPILEENLGELLERVELTSSSSAGAPFWRNKGDCIDDVIDTALPMAVKALKEDRLGDLFASNPEMFLCEVKNKLDRYERGKLDEKTRPYCCLPAHWAVLFSIVSQKFQDGLKTFDQGKGVNAYGFCAPHGGLGRMVKWMKSTSKSRYVVYGDDTCLVSRRGEDVWRVDPDFQQMDGSLNSDDIEISIKWMLNACEREDGMEPSSFWRAVCEMWHIMATDPHMIVDGTTIYRKARPHGMMSGVPGTTMFNTVKSALAWHVYLEVCERDRVDPMNGSFAEEFMARNGLVIKPGTWAPERIPRKINPGDLVTSHKFLGVQILAEEREGHLVFVPTIPEDEALEMLLVQKDNPFERVTSRTTKARTLYDRMRGLFMTFGFGLPRIVDAIHNVVNNIDGVAIVMMTCLGSGEKPEHLILEDYAYPDSAGFPTKDYCLSLYDEGEVDSSGWIYLFPDMENILKELRAESREVEREIKVTKTNIGDIKVDLQSVVVREMSTQTDYHRELDVLATTVAHVRLPPKNATHRARSEIIDPEGEKRRYLPNQGETLRTLLRSGPLTVAEVRRVFPISADALGNLCVKYAIFATGTGDKDVLSLVPIQTAGATLQSNMYGQMEDRDVVDKGMTYRQAAVAAVKGAKVSRLVTAPQELILDDYLIENLLKHSRSERPTDQDHALRMMNPLLLRLPGVDSMRWRTVQNVLNDPAPIGVALEIKVANQWIQVGFCRSISKRMCQGYISCAVFSSLGLPAGGDLFTAVNYLRPPDGFKDWSEEAAAEDPSELAQPQVVELDRVDWSPRIHIKQSLDRYMDLDDRLTEESLDVGMYVLSESKHRTVSDALDEASEAALRYARRVQNFHRNTSSLRSSEESLLEYELEFERSEESKSRTSTGSQGSLVVERKKPSHTRRNEHQRQKYNRKLLLRRKARKRVAQTP